MNKADSAKFKRQVRDYYNKHVSDPVTLLKVARVINYPHPVKKPNQYITKGAIHE